MKTDIQKLIITLVAAALVILAATNVFAATYYYSAKAYFGDANPAVIPGNGAGGTVSLSWYNSTSNTVSTDTAVTTNTTYTSDRHLTIRITPTSGTYRIKSVKTYSSTSATVPTTSSSWTEVDNATAYNSNAYYDYTPSVSRNSYYPSYRYYYVWVTFELLPTSYNITPAIFKDVPVNTALSSCMSTALVKYNGTVKADGSAIADALGTPVSVNVLPATSAYATFTFENTNSDCEVWSVAFDPPSLPPADSSFVQQIGVNSYTTPQITHVTGAAVVVVRYRHKGYTITATNDSAGITSCGSISPIPSTSYEAGSTVLFSVLVNTNCAIDSIIVTDATAGLTAAQVKDSVIAAGNKYTFTTLSANGSITVKFVRVSTSHGAQYCQVPPFMAGQTVLKPNVLMIVDNSGSMAYYPYGTYPACTSADTLLTCTNYYGYFDPGSMYMRDPSNSSKYLVDTATPLNLSKVSLTSGVTSATRWSGNQLNNELMQKVDIIRKILVGGKVESSIIARGAADGTTKYFLRTNGNKLVQQTPDEPQGLIQNTSDKIRFGIMSFHTNLNRVSTSTDGGYVSAPFGSDVATLVDTIEGPDTVPSTNTPLAETLYEAIRYYQAKPSAYNNGVNYGDTTQFEEPIQASCQKHFVLILTDGQPTCDQNIPGNLYYTASVLGTDTDFNVNTWWNKLATADKPTGTDVYCGGTSNFWLPAVAYYAHTTDLRSATVGKANVAGTQNLTIYSVFAFGDATGGAALKATGKYGAFADSNNNGTPGAGEYTTSAGTSTISTGYYPANQGDTLAANLTNVFSSIISSTASGTAAAVANNKSGERGANMVQALFFPQWPNDNSVKWLGEVQALWYYLDPVISYSSIYEDTNGDKTLDLSVDNLPPSDPFATKALWRAGAQLQLVASANRKIYTLLNSAYDLTDGSNEYKTGNLTTSTPTLKSRMLVGALTDTQAGVLVNYIRGTDNSVYRPRKVSFTDPVTGTLNTSTPAEWKLGDIINSTPQVQSSVVLNAYNTAYLDASYSSFVNTSAYKSRNVVYSGSNDGLFHAFRLGKVATLNDSTHPSRIASISGTNMGTEEWAFIPSNALPYIQNQAGVGYCHQSLVDGAPTLVDASINKHSDCTTTNYWDCPTVKGLVPLVTYPDAWKTVVVGSMGLGGASRDYSGSCNETYSPDANAANNTDCVKSPATGDGMSSYFALDVTDPLTPKFMWEFSDTKISADADKGLGFTTPGTTIVRINAVDSGGKPLRKKNGRWFAVMASGPTGAIDSGSLQFTGHSDQNLKIYIVDLNGGSTFTKCTSADQTGCNYWVKDTGIPFAFANSISGASIDLDRWNSNKDGYYSDDVVYITYTKAALTHNAANPSGDFPSSATAWNKGGVIRLVTNHNPDPFTWFTSKLIDDIGPITTSIGKIQDRNNKKLWVYFGEGRYFFPGDETDAQRRFYGVADPCYTQYGEAVPSASANADNSDLNFAMGKTVATCPSVTGPSDIGASPSSDGDLQNQDTPSATLTAGKKGWYVTMAAKSGTAGAERIVSDVTAALTGAVFFTTFIPNSDPCVPGGNTSLWAVNYSTGGAPTSGSLKGKAPVQTSGGSITLIDLPTAFGEPGSYGRKLKSGLSPMGMAPKGRFPPLLPPRAARRILNIQER